MTPKPLSYRVKRHSAFTLIELLVVIAIIAILAGILFPVMATVQESARRSNTMSNMQKIAQAVSAYELDNREYPEFLFGPAICKANGLPDPTCAAGNFYTMKETAALVTGRPNSSDPVAVTASRNARRIFTRSLYPEYIRDVDAFSSANNNVKTPDGQVAIVNRFNITDRRNIPAAKSSMPFYRYDSFDVSPQIGNITTGALTTNFAARYARLWTPVVADPSSLTGDDLKNYQRQLIWSRPPTETVISVTTHHAPKGKVIVLWLNGSAKVVDIQKVKSSVALETDGTGDYQFYKLGPQD